MAGSKKGHKGWIFSTIELFEGKIAQLLSLYNFCDKITKDSQCKFCDKSIFYLLPVQLLFALFVSELFVLCGQTDKTYLLLKQRIH